MKIKITKYPALPVNTPVTSHISLTGSSQAPYTAFIWELKEEGCRGLGRGG